MKFETEMNFAEFVKSLGGKAYLVGGAIRDQIIQRKSNDKDYVITGVDIRKIPFEIVTGNYFPVFLVEISGNKCEVVLARSEKKVSVGHKGFDFCASPEITIMEDLKRRDFTMNSIAKEILTQKIIDPMFGLKDIKKGLIRANTGSFVDDPLRIFRAARFSATLDFYVAHDTRDLMWMTAGNLMELSSERVFKEMEKALMSKNPSKFFEALEDADCLGSYLPGWFPEVNDICGVQAGPISSKHGFEDTFAHTMNAIDSKALKTPLERFAVLCHDFGKALSPQPPKHHGHEKKGIQLVNDFCERVKAPNKYRKSATCFTANHMRMHKINETKSGKAARLICNVNKSMPGGLESFLRCSQADGMSKEESELILKKGKKVLDIRLPSKYHNRGVKCKEILLNLQGKKWKNG